MEIRDLLSRVQEGRYGDAPAEILALAREAAHLQSQRSSDEVLANSLSTAGIHRLTWSKLVGIGRAQHLYDSEVLELLPASFSTLAVLSRCTRDEFNEALRQGLISPALTHRALSAWRKEQGAIQPTRGSFLRLMPLVVALDPQAGPMEEQVIEVAIQEALNNLSVHGELIFLRNWENPNEQAIEQWRQARLEQARQELNRLITPYELSAADLREPLGTLKSELSGLDRKQWKAIGALRTAYACFHAPTNQKRYAARNRLQRAADKGNELAAQLTRVLLGPPGSQDAGIHPDRQSTDQD